MLDGPTCASHRYHAKRLAENRWIIVEEPSSQEREQRPDVTRSIVNRGGCYQEHAGVRGHVGESEETFGFWVSSPVRFPLDPNPSLAH